jgi:hypothetical protein
VSGVNHIVTGGVNHDRGANSCARIIGESAMPRPLSIVAALFAVTLTAAPALADEAAPAAPALAADAKGGVWLATAGPGGAVTLRYCYADTAAETITCVETQERE